MGSPKFPKKKYNTPLHPWKEDRIESERDLIKKYGLKNHKEVWKAKTYLGRYRQQARELLAKLGGKSPQVKKESEQLLLHLTRMGILPAGSSLDDVLALETESILSRRLQTLVYLKGFSNTAAHSRQLISHGHIAVGDRKVTIPSYIVTKDEENEIKYTGRSPLNELSHPARPKTDVYKTGVATDMMEKAEEVTVEPKELKKPEKEKPEKEEEKITSPTKKEDEKTKEPLEPEGKSEEKKPEPTEKLPDEKKSDIAKKQGNEEDEESKETDRGGK